LGREEDRNLILGIHHVAVATLDLERLADFYAKAFGFEVIKTGGWERDSLRHELVTGVKGSAARCWMLRSPNLFLELFEYLEPRGQRVADRQLWDPGYTHFCVVVSDIDMEYERLRHLGMQFHGPPPGLRGDTVRALYGRDPEGNPIELIEFAPGAEHVYHQDLLPGLTQTGD
jgi:catechol 2,3-dioxygenase-like lactoylglutathione lyase family enzyme